MCLVLTARPVQEEWMQNFFQPQQFAALPQTQSVPQQPGDPRAREAPERDLYASNNSDGAMSVLSNADDFAFDPSTVPDAWYGQQPQYEVIEFVRDARTGAVMSGGGGGFAAPPGAPLQHGPMYHQRPHEEPAQHQQPMHYQPQRMHQPQRASYFAEYAGREPPPHPMQHVVATIGVALWQQGRYFVIASITPGSSAAACGLRVGDAIRKIEGYNLNGMALEHVNLFLKGPAGSVVNIRTTWNRFRVTRDCAASGPAPAPQMEMFQLPDGRIVQQPQQQPQPQPQEAYMPYPQQPAYSKPAGQFEPLPYSQAPPAQYQGHAYAQARHAMPPHYGRMPGMPAQVYAPHAGHGNFYMNRQMADYGARLAPAGALHPHDPRQHHFGGGPRDYYGAYANAQPPRPREHHQGLMMGAHKDNLQQNFMVEPHAGMYAGYAGGEGPLPSARPYGQGIPREPAPSARAYEQRIAGDTYNSINDGMQV